MKTSLRAKVFFGLAVLALVPLQGSSELRCTPVPVDPVCTSADDCEAGELCTADGTCQDFRVCATDSECVKVQAGCCPCSMGGHDTAINASSLDEWSDYLGCDPMTACPAVYLCDDTVPACLNGACTLVPPADDVVCGSAVESFPSFSEACASTDECAVVIHLTNCCGTSVAWGIRADEVARFNAAEASCQSQMYQCGCPAYPTQADDGNTSFDHSAFAVRCQNGECFSYVP